MKFTVLGAGAFGKALGGILEKNQHEVAYYDIDGPTLEEALTGAEAIVLCLPSSVVPEILTKLPKTLPLIVATKGLLGASIFNNFTDAMALSGPSYAEAVVKEERMALTITDRRLGEWFRQPWLTFVESHDLNGVLLCGALKNVYAIGAGLRNLEEDSYEWYQYIDRAMSELSAILTANGSSAYTATLPCGRDDLELTCALPSRNYEFGQILYENPEARPVKTVEGVSTIARLKAGEIIIPENAQILRQIMEVVNTDASA